MTNFIKLDDREIATVLAALRERQNRILDDGPESEAITKIATNEGAFDRLTLDEIEVLCDTINHSPQAEPLLLEGEHEEAVRRILRNIGANGAGLKQAADYLKALHAFLTKIEAVKE